MSYAVAQGGGRLAQSQGLAQPVLSHPSSQSEHPARAEPRVTLTPASIYCHAGLFAPGPRGLIW